MHMQVDKVRGRREDAGSRVTRPYTGRVLLLKQHELGITYKTYLLTQPERYMSCIVQHL